MSLSAVRLLDILFGVPQGSILGPLLFNIFLYDLFLIMDNISFANCADDNTPYVAGENIDKVINKLEEASITLFKWFSDNQMKVNPSKSHLLLSINEKQSLNIGNTNIQYSDHEKVLGITIDSKLRFNIHLEDIYIKKLVSS